jgi:hypothetical protein
MQELGPAPTALSPEQIIAQYGSELDKCVQAAQDPQYDFERQIQLNKARLQWQMVLGNHFLVPGSVDSQYGSITDYVPFDSAGDSTGEDMKFCRPLNLIGGDCYKFMAVMGQSAPRVKVVANDPQDTQDISAAKDADAVLRDLWDKIEADRKQRVLAFHQYTTGPTFLRAVWVRDAKKYGQTVEPSIQLQPGPDGNPIPVEAGEPQVYVNGDAELHIYTVMEVSVPFMAKTLENQPLRCEVMRSKWDLLATYAGKDGKAGPLEEYRDGDLPDDEMSQSSSTTAAEARESVANPSRMGRQRRPDQWRFREDWIPTYLYEAVSDRGFREILKRQYPDGLYVAKVGSIKVDIDNRKVTDEWSTCKTGRGEKILEDPIASDSVPIQRTLNDLVGMAQETILRAITQTIIDSSLVDREKWSKKEAMPAEMLLTAMPVDGNLSNRVFQIPPARLSDQVMPFTQFLRTSQQEITGIRPEVSGGGQPTQTYREAKQRKDQALMQLSPQAQEMQYAWESASENLIKLRAKYGAGTIKSPRKGAYGFESDTVDLARLSDTGWHCESDDNFPMSSADRFDKMWALLKEFPPEVQQALSIMDPINLEQTLELLQIPGYESVIEDHKQKTLKDIEQLLAAQPVDGPPGPSGEPGQKQCSLPIDQYDNHAFVASFVQVWMISGTGQKAKLAQPAGFENVLLFWQAQQQAAQPPQPPPPPLVRTQLNVSTKLEDMPPQLTDEVLQGAGMAPLTPGSQDAFTASKAIQDGKAPLNPQAAASSGLPAPSGEPAQPEAKQGQLPPLPTGPPQPPMIQ